MAQSKYDEILSLSMEMDDFLDKHDDWKTAPRSEVIEAMKSLDKWALKFSEMNKAHREFALATSNFMLPNESDKVEETIEDTSRRYREVIEAIKEEDKKRELYSLAGANSDQVKLPKFGGGMGEDFVSFKTKLFLSLE